MQGTGWFEGCICEQLKTKNVDYGKIYDTFYYYCDAISTGGMVEVRSCTMNLKS